MSISYIMKPWLRQGCRLALNKDRRITRLYTTRRTTHHILDISEPVALNKEDIEAVDSVVNLIKVKQKSVEESIRRSKSRQEYVDKKVEVVRRIFPGENGSKYISMVPPDDLKNPYFDVYSKTVNDETGSILVEGTERLSVTKLLTKRWCELSQMYDIYSRLPIFQHKQLKVGKADHEKLENAVHGITPVVEKFMETYEWELATDETHKLAEEWFQSINRLITLFCTGEAREILCHGYIDSRTSQLVEKNVKDDKDILVSGIIDHVMLYHYMDQSPKALDATLRERSNLDLGEIIRHLKTIIPETEGLQIAVSDVKTRPRSVVPHHESVVHASKLQVMYYRNFLEILGKDAEVGYEKLLINAARRKISVDDPINISNLIYFMEIEPSIKPDLEKIMLGEAIGFAPFDEDMASRVEVLSPFETTDIYSNGSENAELNGQGLYDLSEYADLTIDEATVEKYGIFYQKWANPPTLRYFAARLAQMYANVEPLLSKDLMIEYYTGDHKFHTEKFQYDSDLLKKECEDSANFWFGKRRVEPIVPVKKNIVTFCKYCDFHDVCSWRANSSETFKRLGPELERIAKL